MSIERILESFDKFPISTITYICLYRQSTKKFGLSKFFKAYNILYILYIQLYIHTG
jgi:hypothetical protein